MRRFKGLLTVLLVFSILISFSTKAYAAEKGISPTETINDNMTLVGEGYTEDGIFYEVYEVPTVSKPDMVINSVITIEEVLFAPVPYPTYQDTR